MIDVSKLKDLVALMSANDLSEVSIKNGDDSVSIKRGCAAPVAAAQPAAAPAAVAAPAPAAAAPAPAAGPSIDSPMVGTFYSKPNPDAKAFVTPGQSVGPDTVVCIIEAMKVFNEIKAEKAGIVESVLAKDGQAVEFGQRLISLR